MEQKSLVEQLIEEKRREMMTIEGKMSINSIYREVQKIASEMTLEPIRREISCKQFFKVGNRDFVILLYHQIFSREPDDEGYINALTLLNSQQCTRAQLINAFVHSEEGRQNDIQLIGFRQEAFKEKIRRIIRRIPGVSYIGRWFVNIVLLPRRISSLYTSYNTLLSQYKELQSKYEDLMKQDEIRSAKAKEEETLNQANKELCDIFYLHYNEKLMSDSREDVKSRAVPYIEKLQRWCRDTERNKEDIKFIDLGCGECEWIELLNENGYQAAGVDSNDAVVDKVRKELPGINIIRQDSLDYLRNCEDNSIDCISSFHMVEHMGFLSIISLLKECYRVLKKNGMLIIETPNPQNILTATYYFNLDPTHIKPIPIELMQFFLEESGFRVYEKMLMNPLNFEPYEYKEDDPIKDIVFRFNMEQAYSIMVVKE